MNTTNNLVVAPQQQLPPLIKQSSTYKLFVPKKVEEKIRYLCRKFPNDEWSGVLFYTHTGNFEDNSLEIHCEDFFPMDLGNATFTQFKMDESVVNYIANNIELFDCDMGLCHSHNRMNCFFSGTDTNTLREEGNDRNCFVSLIVNNAGTYCAAITRKVKEKKELTTYYYGKSYEFFGEGEVVTNPPYQAPEVHQKMVEDERIEYFMLDVERELTDNPLDYLDARFEEIEAKKTQAAKDASQSKVFLNNINNNSREDSQEDKEFYNWIRSERNKAGEAKEAKCSQPTLFGEEVMEELVDPTKWRPDPTIIHYLVCQLLTCSLIVNKDIDLKQWVVKHMEKKYSEIFGDANGVEFDSWSDSIIEFMINHYSDENVPVDVYEDLDTYIDRIANAFIEEIESYPSNDFLKGYVDKLTRYLV